MYHTIKLQNTLNNFFQVFHWSKLFVSRLKCVLTSVGALVESLLQPTGYMARHGVANSSSALYKYRPIRLG